MQFDDITIFIQIASAGSLTAAARLAGKPKATISHQLRRLEDEIGSPLFTRRANRLMLSSAGVDFLEHAKNIRRACERGLDAVHRSQETAAGIIRVGSGGEFSSNLLAPLLLKFASRNPELHIEMMVLRGDALLSSRDGLDCILYLGEPPVSQASELTGRVLGRIAFALYASQGYLGKHGTPTTPNELRSHDLLGFQSGETMTLWSLEKDEEEYRVQPNAKFVTNDYWTLKLAAVHEQGICFIPVFFAALEVKQGLLTPILPEWKSREVSMYALFPSHRQANRNIRMLISSLSENFNDIFFQSYTATRSRT